MIACATRSVVQGRARSDGPDYQRHEPARFLALDHRGRRYVLHGGEHPRPIPLQVVHHVPAPYGGHSLGSSGLSPGISSCSGSHPFRVTTSSADSRASSARRCNTSASGPFVRNSRKFVV